MTMHRSYYVDGDKYMFDIFVTAAGTHKQRRPVLDNLYDVFEQVRNDERDHWESLASLVQFEELSQPLGCEILPTDA